jgi:flagellin-like protein
MNAKTLSKSRRGISPILATLLLIVIAVAAIVVTYAWIMIYMGSAGRQAGVILKKDADCLWKQGNITIYVRNVGTSDAEIDKVYINNEPQMFTCKPSNIVAKDGGSISIIVDYQWSPNTTYHFRISPKVGEALTFDEKSPSS